MVQITTRPGEYKSFEKKNRILNFVEVPSKKWTLTKWQIFFIFLWSFIFCTTFLDNQSFHNFSWKPDVFEWEATTVDQSQKDPSSCIHKIGLPLNLSLFRSQVWGSKTFRLLCHSVEISRIFLWIFFLRNLFSNIFLKF